MSYYSQKTKQEIAKEFYKFQTDRTQLGEINSLLARVAPSNDSKSDYFKFAYYGIGRRLNIMEKCITNVFNIFPIESNALPKESQVLDLTINLQCFFIHLYGILENLARIYAMSTNFPIKPISEVSFFGKQGKLIKTLPNDLQEIFTKYDEWFSYVKQVRDLLAHQEPFYIPPNCVDMNHQKEWAELEQRMEKVRINWFESIIKESHKPMCNNGGIPSINQIMQKLKKQDALQQQRDKDIEAIRQKQRQYEIFIPMIVADTRDLKVPIMQFYPQILVDIKTIYDIVLQFLRYIVEIKENNND